MYESLYKFLIRHKKIDLPGIGIIALQIQSAESAFVNRSFSPPGYFFAFEKGKKPPSKKLFSWLALNFNISEREAVIRFNDFVFDLKNHLEAGSKIIWNGVGVLQKAGNGEIRFEGVKKELPFLEELNAKKVIRENAEHTMLVGETEKTSKQMTEILLNPPVVEKKQTHWWVWPLAVITAIFIFLGWYFSVHGLTNTSTGNHHKTSPAEAPAGYKLTP
jgi:hypothetical protein